SFVLGYIEIGFIQRKRLYQIGVPLEDLAREKGDGPIAGEIWGNKDRVGAQAFRSNRWHRGVYAEPPGLIGSSADDRTLGPPRDNYGFATQLRIIALLDGSIEWLSRR